jgi:hypothetical protein
MGQHTLHSSAGHETSDANLKPILLTGVGLVVTVAVVAVLIYGIFQYLGSYPVSTARHNPMSTAETQIPPQPRIEEHPAIEIQELHVQEDQTLSTYGWADRKTGKVRIPIDRAMELQLQRGFPTRKAANK